MSSVLFYDGVTPHSYTFDSLDTRPMGGTEATVIRVANGLKAKGVTVAFEQPRTDAGSVQHNPTHVITLRDAGHYMANKLKYPRAQHYLWVHDVVGGDYQTHLRMHLTGQQAALIAVSDFHKTNIVQGIYQEALGGTIRVKRIYNPLADYCVKTDSVYNNKQLAFFSSPHKGLEYTLKLFSYVRNIDPEFTLVLANPGYYTDKADLPSGVINKGSLPHKEVIEVVRNSLCVFYPNTSFAETFGLVYAEANAVGTPVLAHPIGAAREVLSHPSETMDCRLYKEVVDKVIKWSKGERPIVTAKPEFKLDAVISEWLKLLSG